MKELYKLRFSKRRRWVVKKLVELADEKEKEQKQEPKPEKRSNVIEFPKR